MKNLVVCIFLTLFLAIPQITFADEAYEAKMLVNMSSMTLEKFVKEKTEDPIRKFLRDSKGIFICPQFLKGAFIFGVSGGSGVFLVWDQKGKEYNGPAFYTLGGVSIGLQGGGSSSEVILLFMTDRGVSAMLGSNLKLGVDVEIAFGPVGGGAKAGSSNLSADVIGYYTSKGLFGGLSLDGGVVKVRNDLNRAYYGKEVTPVDILITGSIKKEEAKIFTKIVKEYKVKDR